MAKRCPNCGALMADQDVFCGNCGARVPVAEPVHATPPAGVPVPPAEEAGGDRGGLVVAGGVAVAIAGVAAVVVCLCLVVGVVALGLMLSTTETTPTRVAQVVTATPIRPLPTRTRTPRPSPTRTPPPAPTRTPPPAPTRTAPPAPTRTSRSSPTPTKSATYTDNFSTDRGDWNTAASSNGRRWLEGGEFHIKVDQANYVIWARLKDYEYDTLTMEVDARTVSGTGGNYGLLFRLENNDNFYRFAVSTDGNYRIAKLVGRQWTTIKGWTKSSAINTGESTNRLKVVAQGNSITVYANGQELATVTDSEHQRGEVALVVAAGSTANFEAAFDNFQVTP